MRIKRLEIQGFKSFKDKMDELAAKNEKAINDATEKAEAEVKEIKLDLKKLQDKAVDPARVEEIRSFKAALTEAFNEMKKNIFEEVRPRSVFALLNKSDSIISKNSIEKLESFYKFITTEVLKLYPHGTDQEVLQSATAMASDRFIAYSTWKWFDLHR
jgi:vacuolar-type H+-ATPase subunit E/Vma4